MWLCVVYARVFMVPVSPFWAPLYILGQGLFLHQELTHWLAWLVASPPRSPFLLSGPGTADVLSHTWLCMCIGAWGSEVGSSCFCTPVLYPLSHLPSPQAWQLFNFFLICTKWSWPRQTLKSNIPFQSCSLLTYNRVPLNDTIFAS